MRKILFIGHRGRGNHIKSAKKIYKIFLLIDKKEYREEYKKDFEEIFVVDDIFQWKEIHTVLDTHSFDGVLTRFEDFVVQTAAIADYLGLPGVPLEHVIKFRDKYAMRKAFAEYNAPSANFCLISSLPDAENFLKKQPFPLILKQTSGIHSKYVEKVTSQESLEATLCFFQKDIAKNSGNLQKDFSHDLFKSPYKQSSFLLEEMLEGEELSIDAFVVNGKVFFTPICRYITSDELGISDHHLPIRFMPYSYSKEEDKHIYNVVQKGIEALHANFCVVHAEVFYNTKTRDCRLIEIAARGGGFRAEMYKAASENDYDLAYVETVLGIEPNFSQKIHKHVAVIEIFADKTGILKEINTSCLERRSDVDYITWNKEIGEKVGKASEGGAFILKFMIYSQSFSELKKLSIELLNTIRRSIILD